MTPNLAASWEGFKNFTSGISSLATTIGLIVGGVWTYRKFIDFREAAPKIEFNVDLSFIRKQGGCWIIEVIAVVENKGRKAHLMKKFTFDLRYTLPNDPIKAEESFLAYIPNKACEGSWIPANWGGTFIEPGLRTRYSSVASIPESATTALLHGKFFYQSGTLHTSDKLFAVPKDDTS
jgi:hypothetical protein